MPHLLRQGGTVMICACEHDVDAVGCCITAGVASCHSFLIAALASHDTWSMRSTCRCILCTGARCTCSIFSTGCSMTASQL